MSDWERNFEKYKNYPEGEELERFEDLTEEERTVENLEKLKEQYDRRIKYFEIKESLNIQQIEGKESQEFIREKNLESEDLFKNTTFKEKFCEIAKSQKVNAPLDILITVKDVADLVGAGGVLAPVILAIKIIRRGVNWYCSD